MSFLINLVERQTLITQELCSRRASVKVLLIIAPTFWGR